MFTFHLLSIVSILLLLFASLQLTSSIISQDDDDNYPKTSSGDTNGGSGNVQVKVDNKINVHISNSGNGGSGGNQTYEASPQPSSRTDIKPAENRSVGRMTSWPKLFESVPNETTETKYNTTVRKIWITNSSSPFSEIYRYLLLSTPRRRRSVIDDHSENEIKTKTNAPLPVHLNGRETKSSDQSSTELHFHPRRDAVCSWQGHCDGAPCRIKYDCSDDRICFQGRCGSRSLRTEKPCSWIGHCDGTPCRIKNDCSDDRICIEGRCGSPHQRPNVKANTNTNTNTKTNINTNSNLNTNMEANPVQSEQNNIGGPGGNGIINLTINISGGNGGSGGSSFVVRRQ